MGFALYAVNVCDNMQHQYFFNTCRISIINGLFVTYEGPSKLIRAQIYILI